MNDRFEEMKAKPFTFLLEIQERIISFCDVKTIYLLMQTCEHFNEICKKNQIWKLILRQLRVFDEPFDYFKCCKIAACRKKEQNSKLNALLYERKKTLILYKQEQILLPYFICDKNVLDMKTHEPLFISQKLFVGMKNDSLIFYEFDSFSMEMLGSIPYSPESHQWFGQFNDDYLLVGNANSFMVIQTKNEIKSEEALNIQAESVIFDPLRKLVFFIQENKLNCMFLQGNEPVTKTVEIPFKKVENATFQLKGLFVFIVVPQTAIIIFKKTELQFVKVVPIIYGEFKVISSCLVCFGEDYTYNIAKVEYFQIKPIDKTSSYPIRSILSKFNLRSTNAIDKSGNYSDDENACFWWV